VQQVEQLVLFDEVELVLEVLEAFLLDGAVVDLEAVQEIGMFILDGDLH